MVPLGLNSCLLTHTAGCVCCVAQVFEKAGINVSVVYGKMPPEAYRAATGEGAKSDEFIPFFAAGISSVMHPWNPKAPTVHFNYRYFETDAPSGQEGAPRAWCVAAVSSVFCSVAVGWGRGCAV